MAHAERISAPIILFHGLEDEIAPPAQSEAMAAALAANGIPHAHLAFEGEQHGFREAANIIACMEAELSFFVQVLGIPHPTDVPRLELTGR